jgi:LEA14-like dessication related protein
MKIIIRTGFFLLTIATLSACTTDFSKVCVDDFRIDSLQMAGSSKMHINASLKITNPTKQAIQLKTADFDVSTDGEVFAHLHLQEVVRVPARSSDFQPVSLELKITNWLAVIGSINIRHIEEDLDKFLLNGELHVKAGVWNRTLKVENRTLKEIMNNEQ